MPVVLPRWLICQKKCANILLFIGLNEINYGLFYNNEKVRERTDALDALGNTTAATGKGIKKINFKTKYKKTILY